MTEPCKAMDENDKELELSGPIKVRYWKAMNQGKDCCRHFVISHWKGSELLENRLTVVMNLPSELKKR